MFYFPYLYVAIYFSSLIVLEKYGRGETSVMKSINDFEEKVSSILI
jgi:hypothetical protein